MFPGLAQVGLAPKHRPAVHGNPRKLGTPHSTDVVGYLSSNPLSSIAMDGELSSKEKAARKPSLLHTLSFLTAPLKNKPPPTPVVEKGPLPDASRASCEILQTELAEILNETEHVSHRTQGKKKKKTILWDKGPRGSGHMGTAAASHPSPR